MKNAVIIHGICDKEEYFSDKYPSLSNSHWLPWIQKQLLIRDIHTQTPEMPNPVTPNYSDWKREFEKQPVDPNTILIGHSCGAGFLVRWLSEHTTKISHLVLVAPWLDPDREVTTDFFNFELNLANKAEKVSLLYSTDDMKSVLKSVEVIKKSDAKLSEYKFTNRGHFTLDELGTEKFTELVQIVTQDKPVIIQPVNFITKLFKYLKLHLNF